MKSFQVYVRVGVDKRVGPFTLMVNTSDTIEASFTEWLRCNPPFERAVAKRQLLHIKKLNPIKLTPKGQKISPETSWDNYKWISRQTILVVVE